MTITLLYLTHQSTDLVVGFHGDVAIAVFYGVVIVGHITADGANLIVALLVRPHSSSYHGTVGNGAVIKHLTTYSAYVTVITVAGMNVHIHQFEVHDFTFVYLSEESTIVVLSFDFQVSDDVPLSVECSAKLVFVVPSDSMAVKLFIVHIEVCPQLDGPSYIASVAIHIIIPQVM